MQARMIRCTRVQGSAGTPYVITYVNAGWIDRIEAAPNAGARSDDAHAVVYRRGYGPGMLVIETPEALAAQLYDEPAPRPLPPTLDEREQLAEVYADRDRYRRHLEEVRDALRDSALGKVKLARQLAAQINVVLDE